MQKRRLQKKQARLAIVTETIRL